MEPEVIDLVRRLGDGDVLDFTDAERDAARAISQHVGVRKDAATGSLIVAWFPYDADADDDDTFASDIAVDGGEAAEDLHLTLLYLGDPADYDLELVSAALKLFSVRQCWTLQGRVAGVGRFIGDGDQDVVVALVDCPDLAYLRQRLTEFLWDQGVPCNAESGHGYVPHITLAYVTKGDAVPTGPVDAVEFSMDSLTLASGPERKTYDFPSYPESQDPRPLYASRDGGAYNIITKERAEDRYTFGPLYAPDRVDAHGEFTDPETLQKALWEYVRESADQGRRINLQHDDSGDATCGEWVEAVSWPYETTVKVAVPGEEERELVMPPGTVYLGVVWDEPAWKAVKSKKITGYSLGGRTVRIAEPGMELPPMGDKHAAAEGKGKGKKGDGAGMHEYVEKDDGSSVCMSCGESYGSGDHYEKDAAATKAAELAAAQDHAERLGAIREAAESEERRHRAELDVIKAQAADDRGLVSRVIDVLFKQAEQRLPETHIHLPEQNVNIHESGSSVVDKLLEE